MASTLEDGMFGPVPDGSESVSKWSCLIVVDWTGSEPLARLDDQLAARALDAHPLRVTWLSNPCLRRRLVRVVVVALILYGLVLVVARACYLVNFDPTKYVEAMRELPIPPSWELAAERIEPYGLNTGPLIRRYYLVDGEPRTVHGEAVSLVESMGYILVDDRINGCRHNGSLETGPLHCGVNAERDDVVIRVGINDRGQVANIQNDPDRRLIGAPDRLILVITAAGY